MKIKQLATAVLGALALSSGIAFESNKAQAQGVRFDCVRAGGGGFVTTVSNGRKTQALITWNSQALSNGGYPPERRCNEVTQRFNSAFASGSRLRLTTGIVNNQGAICGLQGQERGCTSTNLLITLTPGTDPRAALNQLVGNAGRPLAQSGSVTLDDWANATLSGN